MKPVLSIHEIIVWAVFTLCSGGIAFPFFIARVIYVASKKDANK